MADMDRYDEAKSVKLFVQDADDIKVVSSLLQDALLASADMRYDHMAGEFVAVVNRFCWEQTPRYEGPDKRPVFARTLAGLRIINVQDVKRRGLEKDAEFYNLLTIDYDEQDKQLHLVFSAQADIKIQVTQLQMVLADLSADYPTHAKPTHTDSPDD